MGIQIRQPGVTTIKAQAALQAGGAKASQRAAEIQARKDAEFLRFAAAKSAETERTVQIQDQIRFKREQQEINHQMELERFQRSKLMSIEREGRAQAWQIEKMEMASRRDFEREEMIRQRRLDELDAADTAIDKAVTEGRYAEGQVANQRFKNEMARYGVTGALSREKEPGILSLLGGTQPAAGPDVENPLGLDIVTPTEVSQLPPEQMELIRERKFRVISPDGDEETIKESEWVDYKARGYILAEIPELRERLKPPTSRIQFPGTMF